MTDDGLTLPSRVRVVVLVSRFFPPTSRALDYARAVQGASVEALTVQVDPEETRRLIAAWSEERIDIPLTAIECSGDLVEPVVERLADLRRDHPRDLLAVFIPQYVVGHWWEHLLHHRGAQRLRRRLRHLDGVTVTTVPWQLSSARPKATQTLGVPAEAMGA